MKPSTILQALDLIKAHAHKGTFTTDEALKISKVFAEAYVTEGKETNEQVQEVSR